MVSRYPKAYAVPGSLRVGDCTQRGFQVIKDFSFPLIPWLFSQFRENGSHIEGEELKNSTGHSEIFKDTGG